MQNQFLTVIVMLFLLAACKIDRKPVIDRDKFSYAYTDDSFLFFRNVRQIYYDFQDLPKARWYAYRWSDRYKGNQFPTLNPVIVIDWDKKESYLLVEGNELLVAEDFLVVKEINQRTGKSYTYSLNDRGRENMLEFATKIYEGIMAENQLQIRTNGKFVALFQSPNQSDSFRIAMADYYRLTNIF